MEASIGVALVEAPSSEALESNAQRMLADVLAQQQILQRALERLAVQLSADRQGPVATVDADLLGGVGHAHAGDVMVRCLGSFTVEVGGATVQDWRSSKARALFQYLVTHSDRPVARGVLIEALWPDPDALAADTSLKVAVHTLRKLLVESGCTPPLRISAQEAGYQLTAPGLWLDVQEFERSYARGRRLEAQGWTAEAEGSYARAAELYAGDFLADCMDDWAVFRRESLKDQYLAVLGRLAEGAQASGDYIGCIAWCERLLQEDRCREDTYRLLMLCHGRLGQVGRVRRWYELCARALRTELDVSPDPQTVALYQQALLGQA